jgi:hypothetical protein
MDEDYLLKHIGEEGLYDFFTPFYWFYLALGILVLVAYGCARLYIVIESFLSLRRVPIGVYYTPSWLQMVPHA